MLVAVTVVLYFLLSSYMEARYGKADVEEEEEEEEEWEDDNIDPAFQIDLEYSDDEDEEDE